MIHVPSSRKQNDATNASLSHTRTTTGSAVVIRRIRPSRLQLVVVRHRWFIIPLILFICYRVGHVEINGAICYSFPLIYQQQRILQRPHRLSSMTRNDARTRKPNGTGNTASWLKDTTSSSGINYISEESIRASSIDNVNSSNMNRNSGSLPVLPVVEGNVAAVSSSSSSQQQQPPPPFMMIIPAKLPTIWSSRHELFRMVRPNNIPAIVLLHMLGVYLVMVHAMSSSVVIGTVVASATTISTAVQLPNYWTILFKEPVIWLTLLSTNLVSATSMVVNDYYDAKLGRDTLKQHSLQQQQTLNSNDNNDIHPETNTTTTDTKWILHPINGFWNKLVTRRLLMYLYSMALCISNCLPGIPTRISVNIALMMTYLYTVHLKPMTLIKNIVCAALIALAPWTSGSCTLYLLQQSYNVHIGNSLNGVWVIPSLWRLFGVLFTGVVGREILMDCNDIIADRASGIRTIPVVYGCNVASYVATFTTSIMTYLAVKSPLQQLLLLLSNPFVTVPIWMTIPFRQLIFASCGCFLQLNAMRRILQTRGTNRVVIDEIIQQNLYTVVLLMASFV